MSKHNCYILKKQKTFVRATPPHFTYPAYYHMTIYTSYGLFKVEGDIALFCLRYPCIFLMRILQTQKMHVCALHCKYVHIAWANLV
jgi:hypothetical protein